MLMPLCPRSISKCCIPKEFPNQTKNILSITYLSHSEACLDPISLSPETLSMLQQRMLS